MYCRQCGNKLPEDSLFCDKCGEKVQIAEIDTNEIAQAKITTVTLNDNEEETNEHCVIEENETVNIEQRAPKVNGDFIVNLMGTVKGFFSGKVVQTVQNAAKSVGFEWIVFMGSLAIVCAFAVALNAKSLIKGIVNVLMNGILGITSGLLPNGILGSAASSLAKPIVHSAGDVVADSLFSFGIWFAGGLLISAASYFALSSFMYCGMKFLVKVECKIQCIFNMVAVAMFPMTLIFALNIILGLIWLPLVIVSFFIGLIGSVVLLYAGIQKLEKIDKSPYWTYVLVMLASSLVVVILITILIVVAVAGMTSEISNLALSLGDLF